MGSRRPLLTLEADGLQQHSRWSGVWALLALPGAPLHPHIPQCWALPWHCWGTSHHCICPCPAPTLSPMRDGLQFRQRVWPKGSGDSAGWLVHGPQESRLLPRHHHLQRVQLCSADWCQVT